RRCAYRAACMAHVFRLVHCHRLVLPGATEGDAGIHARITDSRRARDCTFAVHDLLADPRATRPAIQARVEREQRRTIPLTRPTLDYSGIMAASPVAAKAHGLALLLGWPRVRFTLGFALVLGLLIGSGWESGIWAAVVRTVALGFVAMLVFGLFEQWPKRLPRWIARWVLPVAAVAFTMPWATFTIWGLSPEPGAAAFWKESLRLEGFSLFCGLGVLLVPWLALGALVRQKEAIARHQALAFELERSELERQALDARLHLL